MKKLIVVFISMFIAISTSQAFADVVYKRVTNVSPVYDSHYVSVPVTNYREVCREQTSMINSLAGAVVGGVIGNQFGGGSGREIATGVGAAVGAQAGANSSRRNECQIEPYTTYVREPRNSISHYIVTVEGGQTFRTTTYYRVGQIVTIRMTLE